MKQFARNACGTVGLYHILLNKMELKGDLFAEKSQVIDFYESANKGNSDERGDLFLKNDSIKNVHKKHVKEGQSKVTAEVDSHFIAFIEKSRVWVFCVEEFVCDKSSCLCTNKGALFWFYCSLGSFFYIYNMILYIMNLNI